MSSATALPFPSDAHIGEERFRRLVESNILGIFSGDAAGRVLRANDGFLRLVGYTREELEAGMVHLRQLNPPERPWPDPVAQKEAARRGWAAPYEKELIRKDGSRVALLLGGAVIQSDFSDWIGFALDLSDRKQAEHDVQALNRDLRHRVDELETLLAVIPIGIGIARDPGCLHITHNAYFARLLRMQEGKNGSLSAPAAERPSTFRVLKDGRELLPEELPMQRAASTGQEVVGWEGEIHVEGGASVPVLGHAAPLFDEAGRPRGAIGAFVDITERKRAEENERFLGEATALLASSLDYDATLGKLTGLAVPRLGDWCAVDMVEDGTPRRIAAAHVEPHKRELLLELARRFPHSPDWPGPVTEALATGQAVRCAEIPDEPPGSGPGPEYLRLLQEVGNRDGMILPLVTRGRVLGLLLVGRGRPGGRSREDDFELGKELARRAAVHVENARLHREAERARAQAEAAARRSAFLAEAGELLSSSLDIEETLGAVVRLLVPGLADACSVMLLEEDGSLRRVANSAPDERQAALMLRLRELPVPQGDGQLHRVALRTGKVHHVRDYTAEVLKHAAESPEYAALMRELDTREALFVPLVLRGRTLGLFSTAMIGPARRYLPEDIATVVDLARQVAQAVENNQLYLEAQRAVRLRDDFLSIASHELRTPLAALQLQVLGVHRAAKKGTETLASEWVAARTGKAAANVERLAGLIDNLLDVSRLTSGQLELRLEQVDLAALTRDMAERFLEQLNGSSLTVRADHPVVGRWDPFRLEQVLTNLLGNAIKYGRGRPVEVEVSGSGGQARLRVTDQGIGISPESQGRIFERFERAVSTQQYGGFGLGLWISRQIVEAMGGRIAVESEPDVGSTFLVRLPCDGAR
ncbi:MAG TPA: ATP-binding protein [Myxococcaceae bacterium]|nr:ATP-binding protein [Myxococcaceae bacterium]